jgi:hypothetical protein
MGICIMQRAGVMLCNYHVKEYSERREMFYNFCAFTCALLP